MNSRQYDDLIAQYDSTMAENDKLRARLESAEAVIGKLPKCVCCEAPAFYFWAEHWDDSEWRCDEHREDRKAFEHAEPLRAWLKLTEGKKL